MKNLAPVFIMLIILIAFVSAVSAQSKIYNPNLDKGLVFQWRIETETAHPNWKNQDFTVLRGSEGMVIYYGNFRSMASALEGVPALPEGVSTDQVTLVPFFNRKSISTTDALALMGNLNWFDVHHIEIKEAVSFTVYFDTFLNPISPHSVNEIKEDLSFEILPNRTFAYSAGHFNTLQEAETYRNNLVKMGYEYAEVNKYLNGEKVAMHELEEIFAYVEWVK